MAWSVAMTRTLLVAALLGLTPVPPTPTVNSDCPDATTTLAMEECFGELGGRADEELQRYLRRVTSVFRTPSGDSEVDRWDAKTLRLLQRSQESWRRYRKEYCAAVAAAFTTGTMAPVASSACYLRLTRTRTLELREQFQPAGGVESQDEPSIGPKP